MQKMSAVGLVPIVEVASSHKIWLMDKDNGLKSMKARLGLSNYNNLLTREQVDK